MQFIAALWAIVFGGLDLNEAWQQFKRWLTDDHRKTQRRITLAATLLFIAGTILLLSNCTGGPQINP